MQGQGSKKLASAAAGGLPLYLWENARAGQCSKNWRALLGGYPSILQEQGSAVKIGERYRWGATPLSLGKMQGQGNAVKSWSALLGKCRGRAVQEKIGERYRWGLPYLWENARAGQCSKRLASAAGGLPHYLWEKCRGRAVQQKLASAAGGLPLYLAGAGQCSKNLASATAGGRPLYLWEKHGSPNPYEHPKG